MYIVTKLDVDSMEVQIIHTSNSLYDSIEKSYSYIDLIKLTSHHSYSLEISKNKQNIILYDNCSYYKNNKKAKYIIKIHDKI